MLPWRTYDKEIIQMRLTFTQARYAIKANCRRLSLRSLSPSSMVPAVTQMSHASTIQVSRDPVSGAGSARHLRQPRRPRPERSPHPLLASDSLFLWHGRPRRRPDSPPAVPTLAGKFVSPEGLDAVDKAHHATILAVVGVFPRLTCLAQGGRIATILC